MTDSGNHLAGILPAIVSPCGEQDEFLEDAFAELATRLYVQGVHGLYVCGATGDGYHMRLAERKMAAQIAAEISADYGGTLIVHVGASNTRDAVELALHAAGAGAAAVSSMPPANRTQAQLVSYYTDIARGCGLPVLVYHIPAYTGRNPTVDEMLELLDIEGVVGLKFSDYNLVFMRRLLLARPGIRIFNGNDEFLCPGLMYGAHGGIGMTYNLFPRLFLGIYNAVGAGDIARAMDLQDRFTGFVDVVFRRGLIPVFDELMRSRDLAPRSFRRPRAVLSDQQHELVRRELQPHIDAIEEALNAT